MRQALLYATFNGVANCTNGIGRQTKTFLSTVEHRWSELTSRTGPLTPFVAIPAPGPDTWAYDAGQLATAEKIITARGGKIFSLSHDPAVPFWSPPVWRQLSDGATRTALRLAKTYDQVIVIAPTAVARSPFSLRRMEQRTFTATPTQILNGWPGRSRASQPQLDPGYTWPTWATT